MPPFARRILEMDLANRLHNEMALPDLTDPATLGCLLALVTEAYGWEMLPYKDSKGDWGVRRAVPGYRPVILSRYRCKAEALVAALEAAP
jgi:hypothetical protein